MPESKNYIKNIDLAIVLFIFLLLFIIPVLFTRINEEIAWKNVLKIWQDRALLIPLFILNHWLFVPKLILKKSYAKYVLIISLLIASITMGYYFLDQPLKRESGILPKAKNEIPARKSLLENERTTQPPKPVPPYADLLLFSLLIVSVDTGLSFTKYWHIVEEEKARLAKENVQAQLVMLRNLISPHFLMNTLNNIYALIEVDKQRSRTSVMKLSKLMRYLLYENEKGKVLLSKEFDFITNYVDLMKIRFAEEVEISLEIPESYEEKEIPALLFVSYLENAFKYGTSYQQKSIIMTGFKIEGDFLIFTCTNNKNVLSDNHNGGGIGLQNSRKRLDLLYKDKYELKIVNETERYHVQLIIPLT